MPKTARRSRADRDTQAVLDPFLDVLRSSAAITIPQETLIGAISHFTSILSDDQLDAFVQAILTSPSLWSHLSTDDIQRAFRAAPTAKVEAVRPKAKDGWFSRNTLDKMARSWLTRLIKLVGQSTEVQRGLWIKVGILQGLDDVQGVKWGTPRVELEEDIVVFLSDGLHGPETEIGPVIGIFCAVANHINTARLRAMDLKTVVPRLHVSLFTSLGFPPAPLLSYTTIKVDTDYVAALSRGLSSTIAALSDGGFGSQMYGWKEIQSFTHRMNECAALFEVAWNGKQKPVVGGNEWERQKAALFAFLLVLWPAVNHMLQPTDRLLSKEELVDLAALIVTTLSRFSNVTQNAEGGLDGYERVLYGCLDLIAGEGGISAVSRLLKGLYAGGDTSDSLAAFILLVSEQVIHLLETAVIRDVDLPLVGKYIVRPQRRIAFESAFAFMLALVDASSITAQTDESQGPFVDAIVQITAKALLREARDGSVKSEQLRAAYPPVVKAASRRSASLVLTCIGMLDATSFIEKEYQQAVRLVHVSIMPYVPVPDLPAYLDGIAELILSTPEGSDERLELASLAFKTVMQEVPDEYKQNAIEWWLQHRAAFEAAKDPPRARL